MYYESVLGHRTGTCAFTALSGPTSDEDGVDDGACIGGGVDDDVVVVGANDGDNAYDHEDVV